MDIRKIKNKHPKLIKALNELDMYEAELRQLDDLVKECMECEKCDDLNEHINNCKPL